MPTYDYLCQANGQVVEVKHRMSESVSSWGELCALAGIDAGATPANTPVTRLATGGNVVKSGGTGSDMPPCASGGCCGGGACGIH